MGRRTPSSALSLVLAAEWRWLGRPGGGGGGGSEERLPCPRQPQCRHRYPPSPATCQHSSGRAFAPHCNAGGARRGQRAPPPLLWPPVRGPESSLHFVQCCLLVSPSCLACYSDFTMLIWIRWVFALCFDWNSRTWFRE